MTTDRTAWLALASLAQPGQPRRTDAHIVTVGEKEHYDPRSARDAAEYRIALGYSKR
ncbi:hypothetical protein GCM10009827_115180 [Dactylosporangium maewongense]|uniref:Uncharacterized protein n=1 Tax=Dactylosporangium maewongense TaxID=634393 RepID=A0ABP4P8E7_9ACTN